MRAIITNAGYAALVNAQHDGTNKVTVEKVAVGTGTTAADKTDTALENEVKRIDTIAGESVSDNVIHVTVQDETDDNYTVKEFGLILDDGTLFARYAQSDKIIEKSTDATLLLSIDCEFTDVDATQITFGDISFSNPPWSTTTQGVVQMATEAEAKDGKNKKHGMTAKLVWVAIKSFFNGATGAGHGKGLDADKLDGHHSSKTDGLTAQFSARADNSDNANNSNRLEGHPASYFAKAGGDSGQRFNVKDPTSDHHAVSKGWFEDQLGEGNHSELMGKGAFGIGDPILLDSSDNLNDVTTPGHYYWGSSVPKNTPTGDAYEAMRVWNGGDYLIFQDVNTNDHPYSKEFIRIRQGSSKDWYPWDEVIKSGRLETGTGNSKTYPMSQKASTDNFASLSNPLGGAASQSQNIEKLRKIGQSGSNTLRISQNDDGDYVSGACIRFFAAGDFVYRYNDVDCIHAYPNGDAEIARALRVGSPSGGRKSSGSVNAETVYENNHRVVTQNQIGSAASHDDDRYVKRSGDSVTGELALKNGVALRGEDSGGTARIIGLVRGDVVTFGTTGNNNPTEIYGTSVTFKNSGKLQSGNNDIYHQGNLFTTVHSVSRSKNTNYTNTHGKPMMVVTAGTGSGDTSFWVDDKKCSGSDEDNEWCVIIPPGKKWKMDNNPRFCVEIY